MNRRQKIAYENPFFSVPPHSLAPKFATLIESGKKRLSVLLTLFAEPGGECVWQCSIGVLNAAYKPKPVSEWSSAEKNLSKQLFSKCSRESETKVGMNLPKHFRLIKLFDL